MIPPSVFITVNIANRASSAERDFAPLFQHGYARGLAAAGIFVSDATDESTASEPGTQTASDDYVNESGKNVSISVQYYL